MKNKREGEDRERAYQFRLKEKGREIKSLGGRVRGREKEKEKNSKEKFHKGAQQKWFALYRNNSKK